MKLSILDQAPISSGQTAADALQTAVELAQLGDRLGYSRYWIAEHHDLFGLACSNPNVMLGLLGAKTENIRIGAGAVLLPYYKPFQVAETYNLLATLFPGRIDLGLGRAPGGSAEVSLALTDNYLEEVNKFPAKVKELQQFLRGETPNEPLYATISPTPIPDIRPEMWILGTSSKSGVLAAKLGIPYSFGHFMTSENGPQIVETYRKEYQSTNGEHPYVIAAIEVICADTTEEAERIAMSTVLWKIRQDKQMNQLTVPDIMEAENYPFSEEEMVRVKKIKQNMVIGNPKEVNEKMTLLQKQYEADEWMVVTITHDPMDKFRSYELLKEAFI